jgi:hypothetical protein
MKNTVVVCVILCSISIHQLVTKHKPTPHTNDAVKNNKRS